MDTGLYVSFVLVAAVLALSPGSDTAVVLKNSLMLGRRGGVATALGVTAAALIQAVLAVVGLGVLVAQSQGVLQAIRWIGVVYLAWLAFQSLRSAWRGDYQPLEQGAAVVSGRGFWQGLTVNITNPQVLLFYLALFPQFLTPDMPWWASGLLAITHPVLAMMQLVVVVGLVAVAARWLQRRPVRRLLDAITASVMAFLSVRVAVDAVRAAA